jgi:hypothetical protein
MRRMAPFSTYLRSFARSLSPVKEQSLLYPLARGEAVFMVLLVRLSDCRLTEEHRHERIAEAGPAGCP